jgi:hypothetical protein
LDGPHIRYEIDIKPGEGLAANCHCSMCRKPTGAAFFPAMVVPAKKLKWVKGENEIGRYKSSAEGVRLFWGRRAPIGQRESETNQAARRS